MVLLDWAKQQVDIKRIIKRDLDFIMAVFDLQTLCLLKH